MMKRILVLKNPEAGGHNAPLLKLTLDKYISKDGWDYEVHTINQGDRVEEIVRDHIDRGFELIVAAGGDGTVAAAAGGITGTDVPLGIIPIGTGNMLARELKIPLSIQKAAKLISGKHSIRTIDAMELGGRIFVLTVGTGISSLAVKDLTKKEKRIFGLLAYIGSALKQIVRFRPHSFRVTVDGESFDIRSPEVSVSNGGIISDMILPKSPDIRIDDGAVDVIYIKADSIKAYPTLALNVLGRKPPESSIRCIKAWREVTIDSDKPIDVQADGEIVGKTPVSLKVIPGAFPVIVPFEDQSHPNASSR